MQVNFLCPSCSKENVYESGERAGSFSCEHCQSPIPMKISESITERGVIDRCVVCGRELFFIQKDFNRNVGCAIIVAGAIVSIYTYGLALLAAAAVDWFLYRRLREVTVCYFCNSVYRGYNPNPKHKGYDLNIGELVEGSIRGEH